MPINVLRSFSPATSHTAACHMTAVPPTKGWRLFFQARILEWVAMPFSRDLPDQGWNPYLSASCIGKRVLYH